MTPSSLFPARSSGVSAEEPTRPASDSPARAVAGALQPLHGLPVPHRTAQSGGAAVVPLRAPLPPTTPPVIVPVFVPVFVPVCYPVRYEVMLPPHQYQAMTRAQELANVHDFSLPLALAADNYAVLQQCVQDVNRAAWQCHLQWLETGNRAHLAVAQALGIKGALLNGLYEIRRVHKDWLSETPVVSPEKLRYVLPLFRYALHLCRTQSGAVQFPIPGLDPALKHLHQQVITSRESLKVRTGNPDHSAGFTRVEEACEELQCVLEELQHTLAHGPAALQAVAAAPRARPSAAQPAPQAPARSSGPQGPAAPQAAGPRSYESVLSSRLPASGSASPTLRPIIPPAHPAAARPESGARHAPGPVSPTRAPRRPPPRHGPALRISPQAAAVPSAATPPPSPPDSPTRPAALPQADERGPSFPTSTVATPQPVDPAAQLRQERLAALRTTLAPLQAQAQDLSAAAEAAAAPGAVTGHPWEGPGREFAAWQAVVQAYDTCTETLATEAAALFGPGSDEPGIRRLQQGIDKASRQALARAGQAADHTLAAFAQTCHKAIVAHDLQAAGFDSYAQLAEHCRDLLERWAHETPLRPRLPDLEGRMAQYEAYEKVCRAANDDPGRDLADLERAELLYEAATLSRRAFAGVHGGALDDCLRAFHRACMSERSRLLAAVMGHEVDAVRALQAQHGQKLTLAAMAATAIAASCDTLLTGDPLQPAGRPDPGHACPAGQQEGEDPGDRMLIDVARAAIEDVCAQRGRSLELPTYDVPQRPVRMQQAGWAVLRQMELTAVTTVHALECFHALAETLDTLPPDARPASVRERAGSLVWHASELRNSVRRHQEVALGIRKPLLRGWLDDCHARLRTDLRTMERMQAALETVAALLEQRNVAHQILGRIEHCTLMDLAHPEPHGWAYDTIAEVLNADMRSVQQKLGQEEWLIDGEVWEEERELHDWVASTLQERIACEKVITQGRLLLAWAASAGQPGSGRLDRPEDLRALEAQVGRLAEQLVKKVTPALMRRKDELEPGNKYEAQLSANAPVQRDLLRLLKDLRRRSVAADAPAGGSRGAELPAAQPGAPAVRAGRSSRRSRTGRR